MADLTKAQLVTLLTLHHGFIVPEPDLTEVVHRFNALIDALREMDALDVYHVEPWPVQPPRRRANG
jgi:hypothetical protein